MTGKGEVGANGLGILTANLHQWPPASCLSPLNDSVVSGILIETQVGACAYMIPTDTHWKGRQ